MNQIQRTLEEWIYRKTRKPLLVFGPLQSGKKTTLRAFFKNKGYTVIEPNSFQLERNGSNGLHGKHAFLMRMEEVGIKQVCGVLGAPVVYVCQNPYDYKLTKGQLESKFQLFKMLTGKSFCPSLPIDMDLNLSPWEALKIIRSRRDIEEKLSACYKIGERLPQIIFNSYLSGENTDLEKMAKSANSFSDADTFRPGWSNNMSAQFDLDPHYMLLSTLPIIRDSGIKTNLILQDLTKTISEVPIKPSKKRKNSQINSKNNKKAKGSITSWSPRALGFNFTQ